MHNYAWFLYCLSSIVVDSLLNPCMCKTLWKCKCRSRKSNDPTPSSSKFLNKPLDNEHRSTATQAIVAAIRSPNEFSQHRMNTSDNVLAQRLTSRPNSPRRKKPKLISLVPLPLERQGPELPPIFVATPLPHEQPDSIPSFPTMPPMSTITMIAGSGCTCGFQCSCLGCVEHRGIEHVSKDHGSCADGGCTTCVDPRLAELPLQTSSSTLPNSTSLRSINRFFARAAALPPPPINRKSTSKIDPMNVMVYPTTALETEKSGAAFGLVQVPKLECGDGNRPCSDGEPANHLITNSTGQAVPCPSTKTVTIPGDYAVMPDVLVRSCCMGKGKMVPTSSS
jgi:hypothetical protein